jgi:hypothetical protein
MKLKNTSLYFIAAATCRVVAHRLNMLIFVTSTPLALP